MLFGSFRGYNHTVLTLENSQFTDKETPGAVLVEVGTTGYQAQVRAGKHTFLVDEPESMGGKNAGPTPENLILASLGSCTAITLRMYAERKEWSLEKVEVKLYLENGPAKSNPQFKAGEFQVRQQIIVKVWLHGNLQPDQLERLSDIAGKCPVHKILNPSFAITTLVELAAPEFQ